MKTATDELILYKRYKDETAVFLKCLKAVRSDPGKQPIHRLRVEIKKMRALFYLFEKLFPSEFERKKMIGPVRKIFKLGGKIRELQVNVYCLKQYRPSARLLSAYASFVKKQEQKHRVRLRKAISKFEPGALKRTQDLVRICCAGLTEPLLKRAGVALIRSELKAVEKLLSGRTPAPAMHQIRIHLKRVGPVILLLQEMEPNKQLGDLQELIRTTGILIGNWHDEVVLLDSLLEFSRLSRFKETGNQGKVRNARVIHQWIQKIKTKNRGVYPVVKKGLAQIVQAVQSPRATALR